MYLVRYRFTLLYRLAFAWPFGRLTARPYFCPPYNNNKNKKDTCTKIKCNVLFGAMCAV